MWMDGVREFLLGVCCLLMCFVVCCVQEGDSWFRGFGHYLSVNGGWSSVAGH